MSDALNLPSPLVSAQWLQEHQQRVMVLDVRGAADFERAHIPGARRIAIDQDLTGEGVPGSGARRPLPPAADFAAAMGRVGVGNESVVIVVDDARGVRAARLWWMLESLGVSCGVLDGGVTSWRSEVEAGKNTPAQSESFVSRPWPKSHFIEINEVAELRGQALVLDARSAARFYGGHSSLDPRPGHIPGALSAPWTENLSDEDGRILPLPELRNRYESLGFQTNSRVVLYCGSGVTACHNALVLQLLGGRPRVYVGSWSEWASDAARPVQL
ncbi:MAG: sulfurtransferase [Polyangiales bacterium]